MGRIRPAPSTSMASLVAKETKTIKESRTGDERETLHGRKGNKSGRVQNIQLVDLASDAIDFAIKVLYGRRVRFAEFIVQKPARTHTHTHTEKQNDINQTRQRSTIRHRLCGACLHPNQT